MRREGAGERRFSTDRMKHRAHEARRIRERVLNQGVS